MPRKKPQANPKQRGRPAQQTPVHYDPRFARYEAKEIRAISTQRAYNAGRRLMREGQLAHGRLRGQRLEGTFPATAWWGVDHYRAAAILPPAGSPFDVTTVRFTCTCLDDDRPCQHAVALLLSFIERPGSIAEVPGVDQMLGNRSPEELVAIIGKMIEIHPDLESLIDLPPPVPGRSPNTATLDPGLVRSSVTNALEELNDLPLSLHGLESSELTRLLSLSLDYGNANLWADSSLILCELAEQALAASRDDEGLDDYERVFAQCDTGLSVCLTKQAELPETDRLDGEQRARVIRTLYNLWRLDPALDYPEEVLRYGPAAIAAAATTAEKVMVDQWMHNEEIVSPEHAQDLAEFAANLFRSSDDVDNEEVLAAYLDIELWDRVASTQLKLGRIDDAIATAKRHLSTVDQRTRFAAELALVDNGAHLAQAISHIEDYAWEIEGRSAEDDGEIESWLAYHYTRAGRAAEALRLADNWFRRDPCLEAWQCARDAASLPGQPDDAWSSRQGEMESQLKAREYWYDLVLIYASEGRIDDAMATLGQLQQQMMYDPYLYGEEELLALRIAVAEAQERADPEEAIRVYQEMVDQAIAGRTRDQYRQAMPPLARIKHVLERAGRHDEWAELIRGIREKHRNLRAFIEELNAADL
jgi:tetratricopeptide (TPR) repeat protein